jgi:hypothetical protein
MRRILSVSCIVLALGSLAGCAGDPRPGSPEAARWRHQLDVDEGGIGTVSGTQGPSAFAPEAPLPQGTVHVR